MSAQSVSVEDLVRLLLGCAGTDSAGEVQPAAEQIILDTLVDGSRYLLVRLPAPVQDSARLSPRESEIVRLVALGHSNKIIGEVLNISSWTVCTHLRRIFAKIGVGSRAAMVARLIGAGVGHRSRAAREGTARGPQEPALRMAQPSCVAAAPHNGSREGGDA
ncbi:MAG TPA: helix-turn-helix transcriptional regulator [Bryobacteraceae bacterium]|nr:helix-turn-helix transcriptional regulator [Bryobacteraceae bacterium]